MNLLKDFTWKPHHGGGCPCDQNAKVIVRFAWGDEDDIEKAGAASQFDWSHDVADDSKIVCWRYDITPRTDKEVIKKYGTEFVLADFARTLELELSSHPA